MKHCFHFILLICLSFELCGQSTDPAEPLFIRDSLDSYIQKGLSHWNLPGLSVVIVKDGKVVWMKGYGVRDIGSGKAVDENTLFMIASNTKLFTGSSLALLETQGKLSLDDPITRYFPNYRLYDSTTTKLVTIRDLLSHRIGLKTFEEILLFGIPR
jgi:CubicO group peptidase (beta-lactamase class C family)